MRSATDIDIVVTSAVSIMRVLRLYQCNNTCVRRKYLHDDITVSVVVLGTEGSRFPSTTYIVYLLALKQIAHSLTCIIVAVGVSKAGAGAAQEPRARARWADIKKSVDMIKMMKGKESAQAGKVRKRCTRGYRLPYNRTYVTTSCMFCSGTH